jgi:hypothetical protein
VRRRLVVAPALLVGRVGWGHRLGPSVLLHGGPQAVLVEPEYVELGLFARPL